MLTMPVLMLFYKETGLSNEQAFQLKAFYSITIVFMEIPSGYMADLWGRKNTLILGAILGTLGFVIYSLEQSYLSFLFAEITLGLGQSFISGSDSAMMYDSLKAAKREKEYTRYECLNTAIGNISEASSALLGGALASISIVLPFQIQTGIAFLAIPAAITLAEPKQIIEEARQYSESILKSIIHTIRFNRPLLMHILFSSFAGTATLTMAWLLQLFLKEDLKITFFQIGVVSAILNLTIGIISAYAYKMERKVGVHKSLLYLSFLLPLGFILTGVIPGYWVLGIIFLFYALRGYATPVLKDYINMHTQSNIRATILSMRSFTIRLLFAGLGPLAGKLADTYDFKVSYIVIGIIFAILLIGSFFATSGVNLGAKD